MKKKKIDLKDQLLINILIKDSRTPYSDISKEMKDHDQEITPAGIGKRIKNLVDRKIIKKFTIDIDYDAIAFKLPMIILIYHELIPPRKFTETLRKLEELKDKRVLYIFTTSGQYSLGFFGIWKNNKDYGTWKTSFIKNFKKEVPDYSINSMEEIVIWDFYKMLGDEIVHVPEHIKKVF